MVVLGGPVTDDGGVHVTDPDDFISRRILVVDFEHFVQDCVIHCIREGTICRHVCVD